MEIFAVRIENSAGAILRPKASNTIIAQGVSDRGVNRNEVAHYDCVTLNLEKRLYDLIAPPAERFMQLRPAAYEGVLQPLGVAAKFRARRRREFTETRVDVRRYAPETCQGRSGFTRAAEGAREDRQRTFRCQRRSEGLGLGAAAVGEARIGVS